MTEQTHRNPVTDFRLEEYRQWLITSLADADEFLANHHDASPMAQGHADTLYNALERLNELIPPQHSQQQQ